MDPEFVFFFRWFCFSLRTWVAAALTWVDGKQSLIAPTTISLPNFAPKSRFCSLPAKADFGSHLLEQENVHLFLLGSKHIGYTMD